MSLKKATLSGAIWTLLDVVFLKGLFFAAGLLLARILGPEEFGLLGMIAVFIAIGKSLIESGMSSSLIRTLDADNEDYSTVFYLNIGASFFVYAVLFLCAPLIAQFFDQAILTDVIRLYCFTFVITALSAVQLAILNKEMQFKKITLLNIPGTLLGIAVGIYLAYQGYGIWSLVWMYLVIQLILSILLWLTSSWKPSFLFSKAKMKIHLGFGYKLTISGLIDKIYKNIYNIIIGKYFPVETLGFYERAKSFNEYPATFLTSVIRKVTYPLLNKIRDDKDRISDIYKQILQFTFFCSAPLFIFAAALAEPLFLMVLGEEWIEAALFFQIFCLAFMFYPIQAFNINALMVYGRSDLFLKLELIKKAFITVVILIALPFGVYALVWCTVITSLFALGVNTYYSGKLINYSTYNQLRDLSKFLVMAVVSAVLFYVLANYLAFKSLTLQVVFSSFVGVVVYLSLNLLFKTKPIIFVKSLILKKNL